MSDYGGTADRIELVGLNAANVVSVRNSGGSLVVNVGGGDQIVVNNMFSGVGAVNTDYAIESLRFADGTSWDIARLQAEAVRGTTAADTIVGFSGNDTIRAGEGNDTVQALDGNDVIEGGAGDDYLYGVNGNDSLQGGAGADYLDGGEGNDTLGGGAGTDNLYDYSGSSNDVYRLTRGDGSDTVSDYGGTADRIELQTSIVADQVWFRRVGSDLEMSIIGTADRMTVSNWYSNAAHRVEQFQTTDGRRLLDSQVQSLVDAMASFAPPAAGQTTLPPDYRSALGANIAANWQPANG